LGRAHGDDPEHLVTEQFMRFTAYDKRHRLSCFQRCFEDLLGPLDPDLEAAATPLNLEAKAAPIRRQLRIHTLRRFLSLARVLAKEKRQRPDAASPRHQPRPISISGISLSFAFLVARARRPGLST
jgi:hypothetical protein